MHGACSSSRRRRDVAAFVRGPKGGEFLTGGNKNFFVRHKSERVSVFFQLLRDVDYQVIAQVACISCVIDRMRGMLVSLSRIPNTVTGKRYTNINELAVHSRNGAIQLNG